MSRLALHLFERDVAIKVLSASSLLNYIEFKRIVRDALSQRVIDR